MDRTKQDVVGLYEVTGPGLVRMISDESLPSLSVRPSWVCHPQVLLNRSLADADFELEQLAADALGSPQPVVPGHRLDERKSIDAERTPSRFGRASLPTLEEFETLSVPPEQRAGLHDHKRISPAVRDSGERDSKVRSHCVIGQRDFALRVEGKQ